MHIKNLSNTDLEDIVFAVLMAFDEYFVTMPSDVAYWESRYKSARVDFEHSYGMFDGTLLIGFIINGIDERGNERVAFNTGTGVVSKYRGQKIVDQLYAYALPKLKEKGVTTCVLEVIQENYRAIRVYERIGFSKIKNYLCFKGKLAASSYETTIKLTSLTEIQNNQEELYCWDNCNAAILKASPLAYETYEVYDKQQCKVGFFVINPNSGHLPQFEIYSVEQPSDWNLLLDSIAQISRTVKINNVIDTRTILLQKIKEAGLENHINQYEMEWKLNKLNV